MKLLIITQKVDGADPILGFFYRWIEEFASHCDKVIVTCLQKGDYDLPKNIRVLSLGKEKGVSRLKYVWNFYKYIWQERENYDKVFVHMNQEYIVLGGLFWRILGKKIFLWRNHLKGNFLTCLAILLSDRVFCTSPRSFTARFKKTKLMPVGIDTDFFKPNSSISKKPNSILFLGRISPVKNVAIFVDALNELQKLGTNFSATIAGSALARDGEYEKIIQAKVSEYKLGDKIKFTGPVTQNEAQRLYCEHELYVNLTPAGSLDKTIFEAMACETTSLVYNQDLEETLGDKFIIQELRAQVIAKKIGEAFDTESRSNFRNFVAEKHSLRHLINKIIYNYEIQS